MLPLAAAGMLVLVYAFRSTPEQLPSTARDVAEIKLKGDFERKWAVNEAGFPIRGLTAMGNTVYYAARGVCAVDAATGAKLWETEPAADSTPAVSEGTVAYGGRDNNLYAFDTATGKEKWRFRTVQSAASPAISGGSVFYGTSSGDLHALDAVSGEEKWHAKIPGGIIEALAAEGNNLAVLSTDSRAGTGTITVLDAAAGRVKWTESALSGQPGMTLSGGIIYIMAPVPGSNPPFSDLRALDAENKTVKWEKNVSSNYYNYSPMRVIDGTLYVGNMEASAPVLSGLDPGSGTERWACRLDHPTGVLQPSAAVGGLVFFGGSSEIFAADAVTGDLRWHVSAGGMLSNSPAVAGDSICFTYGSGGTLYALPLPKA